MDPGYFVVSIRKNDTKIQTSNIFFVNPIVAIAVTVSYFVNKNGGNKMLFCGSEVEYFSTRIITNNFGKFT